MCKSDSCVRHREHDNVEWRSVQFLALYLCSYAWSLNKTVHFNVCGCTNLQDLLLAVWINVCQGFGIELVWFRLATPVVLLIVVLASAPAPRRYSIRGAAVLQGAERPIRSGRYGG